MRRLITLFFIIGLVIGSAITVAYERSWRENQNWNTVHTTVDEQLKDNKQTLQAIELFLQMQKQPEDEIYDFALDRVVRILLRERSLELWQYQRLTTPEVYNSRGTLPQNKEKRK